MRLDFLHPKNMRNVTIPNYLKTNKQFFVFT